MENKPRGKRNKKEPEDNAKPKGHSHATTTTTHKKDRRRRRRFSFWSLGLSVFITGLGLPWGLRKTYTYFFLQRPELLANYFFVSMRPATAWTDPRRVLIVGTLSGGTTQVATDLRTLLGLEICHETMDCSHYVCRDGTVSLFHGIRFVPQPADWNEALDLQCANDTPNMGVHPGLFADTSHIPCTQPSFMSWFQSSSSSSWSNCWAGVCRDWLRREWGCALLSTNNNNNNTCPTPLFDVILHQVRHPLRTIESLVAKFCHRTHATMHPNFAKFPQAWFGRSTSAASSPASCLVVAGTFVVDYHNAMLRAKKAGLVHYMYRIEDTSPCQVAEMAGWMNDAPPPSSSLDATKTIWPKSRQRVHKACRDATTTTKYKNKQKNPQASMTSTLYKVNRGAVSLTYANFTVDAASRALWDQLVILTQELGYPPLEQQQQIDSSSDDDDDIRRGVDQEF